MRTNRKKSGSCPEQDMIHMTNLNRSEKDEIGTDQGGATPFWCPRGSHSEESETSRFGHRPADPACTATATRRPLQSPQHTLPRSVSEGAFPAAPAQGSVHILHLRFAMRTSELIINRTHRNISKCTHEQTIKTNKHIDKL